MRSYLEVIKPLMSKKRFEHSKAVAHEAVRLAKIFDEDKEKAYTAGILHDICKEMPPEAQLQCLANSGIMLCETLSRLPNLWHSMAGACYIANELSIQDQAILNAVRYHTSARAGMSKLEKIIYLADLTSRDRRYPGVEQMRRLARTNLDQAMREALLFTRDELKAEGKFICTDTYGAFADYGIAP